VIGRRDRREQPDPEQHEHDCRELPSNVIGYTSP
jgi:hypothetical protein